MTSSNQNLQDSWNWFFRCCFGFKSANEPKYTLSNVKNDRYIYVVEKLAIKRIPMSSFATEEDLAEIDNPSSSSFFRRYPKSIEKESERKSTVTFASYFASIQPSKSEMQQRMMPLSSETMGVLKEEEEAKESPKEAGDDLSQKEISQILNDYPALYKKDAFKEIPQEALKEIPEGLLGNQNVRCKDYGVNKINKKTVRSNSPNNKKETSEKNQFGPPPGITTLPNRVNSPNRKPEYPPHSKIVCFINNSFINNLKLLGPSTST